MKIDCITRDVEIKTNEKKIRNFDNEDDRSKTTRTNSQRNILYNFEL